MFQAFIRINKNKQQRGKLLKIANNLAIIEIEHLKKNEIKGIILDLDNTVISEDDRYLSPRAENWIKQAKLAGLNFFILSNGKRRHRILYWSERLNIPAINRAKKPFPSSFRKAMNYMQLPPNKVVVIGDSLHTDVLGAKLCRCHYIQVATLPHPPRWWERLAGKFVQIPYSQKYELWDFNLRVYEDFL